jgi:hypothetical protein
MTEEFGIDSRQRQEIFLLQTAQTNSGAYLSFYQWVPGAFPPRLKWLMREADRLMSSSSDVQRICIYTSTATYAFQ